MKTATIILGLVVLASSVSAVPQGNRQQGGFGGFGQAQGNNNGKNNAGKNNAGKGGVKGGAAAGVS